MVAAAWTGAADADLAMLLVDAAFGPARGRAGDRRAAGRVRPALLAGAEQDRSGGAARAAAVDRLAGRPGDVRGDLHGQRRKPATACGASPTRLAEVVPEGPWLYPEDDLTDLPDRLLAAETVREQIFMQTHEEVPYGATVETEVLQGAQGRFGSHRRHDLRRPARPQGDPDRRQGQQDQSDRCPRAARSGLAAGPPGAPVPQRQGTQGLGRGGRPAARDRAGGSGQGVRRGAGRPLPGLRPRESRLPGGCSRVEGKRPSRWRPNAGSSNGAATASRVTSVAWNGTLPRSSSTSGRTARAMRSPP